MSKQKREPLTIVDPAFDRTVDASESDPTPGPEVAPERLRGESLAERYDVGPELGRGGMGVVLECFDRRVGRQLALKTLVPEIAGARAHARFMREARIQGQLEHPSIIPLYDLGDDPDGGLYFTMKKIEGVTLAEVLDDPDETGLGWSERRLLAAFVQACKAIDFAHRRGVLHRDLKPSNLMLGDFGEVYVLDWGIARVQDEEAGPAPRDIRTQTVEGAVIGTVGYMSPEQAIGDLARLGPHSDVYALGAILFEILCRRPLIEGEHPGEIRIATISGVDARPSVRAPERNVAPELEAIVVRATRARPEERYPDVASLVDELERYLDGARDETARREKAAALAAEARGLATEALADRGDPAVRAQALRGVGRSLALDPENRDALAILLDLLAAPPDELPPEASRSFERARSERLRGLARSAFFAYFSLFLYVPFLLWMGVRDWVPTGVYMAGAACATVAAFVVWRRGARSHYPTLAVAIASHAAFGGTIPFFGPLLLAPALLSINAATFALALEGRPRTLSLLAVFAVYAIGSAYWLHDPGAGYTMADGALTVTTTALGTPTVATWTFLIVATLGNLLTGAWVVGLLRDDLFAAERRHHLELWQLRAMARAPEPTPGA